MLKLKFTIKNRLCLVELKPEAREAVMGTVVNQVRDLVDEHLRGNGGREFWHEAADSIKVTPVYSTRKGKLEARLEIYKRGVHLRYAGGIVKPTGNISELTGKPTKSLLIPSRELRADGGDLIDNVRDPRRVHTIKNKAGRVYLVYLIHVSTSHITTPNIAIPIIMQIIASKTCTTFSLMLKLASSCALSSAAFFAASSFNALSRSAHCALRLSFITISACLFHTAFWYFNFSFPRFSKCLAFCLANPRLAPYNIPLSALTAHIRPHLSVYGSGGNSGNLSTRVSFSSNFNAFCMASLIPLPA